MTPEQKIIAIAEFEGWKIHPKDRFIVIPPNSPHSVQPLHTLPLYLTSRDAICGAVARLDDEQKRVFANTLYDLHLGCDHDHKGYHPREIRISSLDLTAMILAAPAQLADALLLTLGHEI